MPKKAEPVTRDPPSVEERLALLERIMHEVLTRIRRIDQKQ